MKKLFLLSVACFIIISLIPAKETSAAARAGYIFLQVEARGEAWYLYPENNRRYYLGRPEDAFNIMKRLSLGVEHNYLHTTAVFPARLRGRVLLDVQARGEAYYIHPLTSQKYYLGRPADALRIMQQLGVGIRNADLVSIPIASLDNIGTQVRHDVPFTPQAPLGNWSDPRQADGCEEASALMAVSWARFETFSRAEAEAKITSISDYELSTYGEFRDSSITDTFNRIIKEGLNYHQAVLVPEISFERLVAELRAGKVVIAPLNGEAISPSPYRQPPPPHHMILIRGYDPVKKVFIVNDPGITAGGGYEYDSNMLYAALRDYPTGYRLPVEQVKKNVILVSR